MKKMFLVLSSLILSISSLLTFNLCYKNNTITEINTSTESISSQTGTTNTTVKSVIEHRRTETNSSLDSYDDSSVLKVEAFNHIEKLIKRCNEQEKNIDHLQKDIKKILDAQSKKIIDYVME